MPRSEASKARRRAWCRQWRASPEGKDYHARWRSEHRVSERERKTAWRDHNRDLVRAAKARYYALHPRSRPIPDLPSKFQGHEFFDTARFICGPEPYWDASLGGWEEAMGEVVLALVEGRDPNAAATESWRREREWKYHTGSLFPNVDVDADTRRVVYVARRPDR